MTVKRTLVIGASTNPSRYSHFAIHTLRKYDYDVIALAKRPGKVSDVDLKTNFPINVDVHTVTMYIGRERQEEYYESILALNPKRVIFNPGAENPELAILLENSGIEAINACTLVMLNTGQY